MNFDTVVLPNFSEGSPLKKSISYITKKSMQSVFLVSLFFATILIVSVPHASAQLPKVELNPTEIVVSAPGQNFTVDVNVTDVVGLGAWEYKITYNTTLLDAVWCYKTAFANDHCEYFGPVDPVSKVWTPTSGINDSIGGGLGRVWTGAAVKSGHEFTGDVSLMTIEFTAKAVGTCPLHFTLSLLGDSMGDPIAHETIDGSVTVIPPPLPVISLNPSEYTAPAPSESFHINVNITGVINLQYYEFKLWFNNTLLNATDVIPGPVNPPGTVFIPNPLQNVSDGFVRAGAFLPAGQAFTGNGILMAISFTALTAGNSTLHLNETVLTDPMGVEIDYVTLDGFVKVLPKIGDCHTHHINDATDDFPNDYAPVVIPINGKNVTIAPFINCTTLEDNVFKANYHPCKLAQTFFVDNDWSDGDANYTYAFEDWTDYDWNDIVVSLYAVTNNLIITAENFLESREAVWKNPFGVEITPIGMPVEVHWNSTDYPGDIITVNSGDTVDIELFAESNLGDTAFLTIIPLIPPTASFVYSPLNPQAHQDVTFDASASKSNVGYIVSYEWDFGDSSLHGSGMIVTHQYATVGNYNVTLNVTDSEGMWDTESKIITVTPRTYTLTITSTLGGTTIPFHGNYSYDEGTIVSVTATPEANYLFDRWELDDVNVGSANPTSVTMNKDHVLHAVFKEAPALPVGGHAVPIEKHQFLAPKINLIPEISLAFVFLAAMAVTIILIRRRNKTLRWGH